jgi:hypothetical protein
MWVILFSFQVSIYDPLHVEASLFFFFFLDYTPRILWGFTWRPQKEPPISNSKIPHEVEIPTFEERVRSMANSGIMNEYDNMFLELDEGSSSSAPPPPPPGREGVYQPLDDPEAPADWISRISTDIFGWSYPPPPPPYDGM